MSQEIQEGKREDENKKVFTLCIVYKHPKVLLGFKKRGFGQGRWNGFGGKLEEGESEEEAAKRELEEEVGLTARDLERAGELDFEFKNNGKRLEVVVFKVSEFSGQERESDEMRPKWFFVDEIPFKEMWPSDVYWMPLFFAGRNFKGNFIWKDEDTLLDRKVEII